MKKYVLILATILISLISMTVYADTTVKIKDSEKDILTVSGNALDGETVTILILNPGHTFDEYKAATDVQRNGMTQYFGIAKAAGTGFTKDIAMNADKNGDFTFIITRISGQEPLNYTYYGNRYKTKLIGDFNDAADDVDITDEDVDLTVPAGVADDIISAFGLSSDALISKTNLNRFTGKLLALRDSLPDKKYAIDVDLFTEYMYKAAVLSFYGSDNSGAAYDENGLLYKDILGIDKLDVYADYGFLNTTGKLSIAHQLSSTEFSNCEKLCENFEQLFFYHIIKNYSKLGHGHVSYYLDKYTDEYTDAGFDFSITAEDSVYMSLLSSTAGTLEDLAKAYNELVTPKETGKETEEETIISGSSGSFGKGSSGGSYTSSTQKDSEQKQEETEKPKEDANVSPIYTDISKNHWAYDAIKKLTDEKVINGHNGLVRPNDTLTRAELTKILSAALKLEDTVDNQFADVSKTDWFEPYVSRCAAKGIVMGSGNSFNPNEPVTRQDVAVMLYRACADDFKNISGEISFKDSDSVADYAKEAVGVLTAAKKINGFEDGSFAPRANITRAEAISLVYRIIYAEVNEQ